MNTIKWALTGVYAIGLCLQCHGIERPKPGKKPRTKGLMVVPVPSAKAVRILIGRKLFTSYRYSEDSMKPVLWPVISPGNKALTRGFPIGPKQGERTDHPHHVGMWLNFGDVNGHDFWNNSFNIGKEHKGPFGKIVHKSIDNYHSGDSTGDLLVRTEWHNASSKVLLNEQSLFQFENHRSYRIISRITELSALSDTVFFRDNKEGFFAMRVARFLEHTSTKPELYVDANGKETLVPVLSNEGVSGRYLSSEGIQGEAVWGKRAKWILLKGFDGRDSSGILIFDHPGNPGYPSHWHARGYGLFAINPLGARVFTDGKEELNFAILPSSKAVFAYQVVLWTGKVPDAEAIDRLYQKWASRNPANELDENRK